jgi:hypothetical protein
MAFAWRRSSTPVWLDDNVIKRILQIRFLGGLLSEGPQGHIRALKNVEDFMLVSETGLNYTETLGTAGLLQVLCRYETNVYQHREYCGPMLVDTYCLMT